jgi:hypothetical protein
VSADLILICCSAEPVIPSGLLRCGQGEVSVSDCWIALECFQALWKPGAGWSGAEASQLGSQAVEAYFFRFSFFVVS